MAYCHCADSDYFTKGIFEHYCRHGLSTLLLKKAYKDFFQRRQLIQQTMKSNFGKIFENIVYYLIFLPGLIYLSWASMRNWILELSDPHSTVFLFEKKMLVPYILISFYYWIITVLLFYWGIIKKIGITNKEFWRAFYLCLIALFLTIATIILAFMLLPPIIPLN